MKIITHSPPENVMVIGKFESMHLGHQALVHKAKARSVAIGLPLVVMSFCPHPASVLGKATYRPLIPREETEKVLRETCMADYLLKFPFTKTFAKHSPKEFCKILFVDLKVMELFVGEDYRYGANRSGGTSDLTEEAMLYGKRVTVVPFEKRDGMAISSSRIRELIKNGCLEEAYRLLGFRPSSFDVRP